MHPLYRHAQTFVGQPIYVHCNGRVHYGVLHSVTTEGLYLRQTNGNRTVSGEQENSVDVTPLHLAKQTDGDIEEIFWPLFFLPWLAIAALGPWAWW